jgi:hypothetical protein
VNCNIVFAKVFETWRFWIKSIIQEEEQALQIFLYFLEASYVFFKIRYLSFIILITFLRYILNNFFFDFKSNIWKKLMGYPDRIFVLNKAFTRHSKTGQCHFNSSWKEASPTLRLVLTALMSVNFWSKGKEYIYIDKRPSLESNTGPSCRLAGLLPTTLSFSILCCYILKTTMVQCSSFVAAVFECLLETQDLSS